MSVDLAHPAITPRQHRAPQGNGDVLVEPSVDTAAGQVLENRHRLDRDDLTFGSTPLRALRDLAAAELAQLAGFSQCSKCPPSWSDAAAAQRPGAARPAAATPSPLVIATGHQPELYHPGVWAKNLIAESIRRRIESHAGETETSVRSVNLTVDTDLCTLPGIRVPAGTVQKPWQTVQRFDAFAQSRTWYSYHVADRAMFRSFGDRVLEAMRTWGINACIEDVWPTAVELADRGAGVSAALTASRQCFESRRYGLRHADVSLTDLSATESFAVFAAEILFRADKFAESYNQAVRSFRRRNGIRSDQHPLPELANQHGRTEIAFWHVDRAGQRHRPVLTAGSGCSAVLSFGDQEIRLPLDSAEALRSALQEAGQTSGLQLRSRALTTTLFSRLILSDLFIHGIGGSKYDEMTDEIIAGFYRIPVPEFVTATATLRLPIVSDTNLCSGSDLQRLRFRLRELRFRAEDYLLSEDRQSPGVGRLLTEKARLIEEQHQADSHPWSVESGNRNFARYLRFREINDALSRVTRPQQEDLERRISECQQRQSARQILESREYSFVTHPVESLDRLAGRILGRQVANPS